MESSLSQFQVIVSRTNFISSHTTRALRIIGLSTALANARDLADWLGIGQFGLFNFRPSVRPVPLEVHIAGFPGKHYCPRMATMNKPSYQVGARVIKLLGLSESRLADSGHRCEFHATSERYTYIFYKHVKKMVKVRLRELAPQPE